MKFACWFIKSTFYSFFLSLDLIQCTNEMNVNIPQLADTLFERTANTSWVVVFKSLTTTHQLMVYGNEVGTRRCSRYSSASVVLFRFQPSFFFFFFFQRFIQYLASRNTLFNLSNFLDKSGLQGIPVNTINTIFHQQCLPFTVVFFVNVGYDMSTFIRRYSRYLNEKAVSYRQVAFDFTKVKRG